jgi:hypothetical protein
MFFPEKDRCAQACAIEPDLDELDACPTQSVAILTRPAGAGKKDLAWQCAISLRRRVNELPMRIIS